MYENRTLELHRTVPTWEKVAGVRTVLSAKRFVCLFVCLLLSFFLSFFSSDGVYVVEYQALRSLR